MRSSFQFQGDPLIEDIRVTASRALLASTENEAPLMAEILPEANSFNVAGSRSSRRLESERCRPGSDGKHVREQDYRR